jgi:hypothetical protein
LGRSGRLAWYVGSGLLHNKQLITGDGETNKASSGHYAAKGTWPPCSPSPGDIAQPSSARTRPEKNLADERLAPQDDLR